MKSLHFSFAGSVLFETAIPSLVGAIFWGANMSFTGPSLSSGGLFPLLCSALV